MSDKDWDGIDRRKLYAPKPGPNAGTSDAAFLQYIVDQLETINSKMDIMHAEHGDMKGDVKAIKAAFPKTEDGEHDFDGHHDDHTTRQNASKWIKGMFSKAFERVFTGATWGLIMFIAYATWRAVKDEVKR